MSSARSIVPATAPISGAQALIQALEEQGVTVVFGYPGGAIMPVYDALTDSKIQHVLTRHEQAAALAADAWGRVTGCAGVCMATSGPGATNLITGIANAYLDSVPMVAITGQVASPLMGTDAFQEVDIFGMTLPVVKHSYIVRRGDDIAAIVREAFALAESGRPGPVLIDLPKDVTLESVVFERGYRERGGALTGAARTEIEAARRLLEQSRRPLFYVGGGVAIADAVEATRAILATTGLPMVATLKGLGALDTEDPQFLGMLGMHGSAAANRAVQECDLLITVGARFDDRATGKLDEFAPKAKVIHLDVDPAEVGKLRAPEVSLIGCLKHNLAAMLPRCIDAERWFDWRRHCLKQRAQDRPRYDAPGEHIYAPALLKDLSELAGPEATVCADVGQHQMWVAQHCRIFHPRQHLSSGGLGTMGFAVPAAMGAKLARPNHPVIAVTGDGSVMMNIQELATLKRYGIDIKIVVLDNSRLGMVRQWQELFFDENYSETDLSDNPDFTRVARAFGIEALRIDSRAQVRAGLEHLLATRGPALLHVPIDPQENVWPLVPPGKSNDHMMLDKGTIA